VGRAEKSHEAKEERWHFKKTKNLETRRTILPNGTRRKRLGKGGAGRGKLYRPTVGEGRGWHRWNRANGTRPALGIGGGKGSSLENETKKVKGMMKSRVNSTSPS